MSKTVNFRDIQSIRFAKSAFSQDKAQDFLKAIGGDASMIVENDTSFDFVQQPGEHKDSVKLAKGVQGLLLKTSAAPVEGQVEKTIPIDETPDEVPPVVVKSDDGKEKPKAKGDGRVTHAVQSWGDVLNHSKGCSQYHTKAAGLLDHGPSAEMHKEFAGMEKEKQEKIKAFVKEHFGDMDMDEISAAQVEVADDEKSKQKKKAVSVNDGHVDDASSIDIDVLQKEIAKRAPVLESVEKALAALSESQKAVKDRFRIVA